MRNSAKQAPFLRHRVDLCRAFFGEIRPNPPCTFALLEPHKGARPAVAAAAEMQNHVLTGSFCITEVIKIYNAAIRQAHKIHDQY
jgi:hypothetical protein